MKNTDLQDAIGNVGDDLVRDASECGGTDPDRWYQTDTFKRITAVAAVFVLCVTVWLIVLKGGSWFKPSGAVDTPAGNLPNETIDSDSGSNTFYNPEEVGCVWSLYTRIPENIVSLASSYIGIPTEPFEIPGIAGVEFTYENDALYANGEHIIGGSGYVIMSLYYADFTDDGVPELCFCMSFGSGICDDRVVIIDYTARKEIFTLADRMKYDFCLFTKGKKLYVNEYDYNSHELVATGIICKTNDTNNPIEVWATEPMPIGMEWKTTDSSVVELPRYTFEYKNTAASAVEGFAWCSQYDDKSGDWFEGDGMGLAWSLLEDGNPPTIYFDGNGSNKIYFKDNGETVEKSFQLWQSDGSSTLDYGGDFYGYIKNNPGTYFITVEIIETGRTIDGMTEKNCVTQGVRLIVK